MLPLKSLYRFLDSNFDYVLAVDVDELITHASTPLHRDACPENTQYIGRPLDEVLTPSSVDTFRSAMFQARERGRGIAVFSPIAHTSHSIPLKAAHTDPESGDIFIFFGDRLEGISKLEEWEKDERIKELTCIYRVAELIEVSRTIPEFFEKLPISLSQGMLYPDDVVVFSSYQGIEYGRKPASVNYISVKLVVAGQAEGEILAGYDNESHKLLPEEQKMLDEIGRMLNLALERRELREKLHSMEEEEADYDRRLEELKAEIASRTSELEEQKNKLSIVDSYLDRVNRGWEEVKSRLKTIFSAIPDDVVLLDKNRRVVMTNRTDVEPGEHCYTAMFGRDKPCNDCRLARILKDKTPLTLTMKRDDKYMQVHALPVYNQDHEVDGILEFYRDVTLEKTYDQQLQQADKLASLGELVSGIGHEINNPNQFIRGNIKIIKQALDDMLPIVDEYRRSHPELRIARLEYEFFRQHIMTLVDDMAHGSDRIKEIVAGLRLFTRKDDGLLVDTVDLNTMIEACTRLVHNEVHKHAEIELELEEELPAFVGNAQKIEQVLINLIVNASQAMPDDRKGLITVRTRTDDADLIVEIADNGVGMNEQTLKQIFDPFFTTKRAKGGTGLGLAIVYRIVEEHGGSISVSSKSGVGTTFTIRIPSGKGTQRKLAKGNHETNTDSR